MRVVDSEEGTGVAVQEGGALAVAGDALAVEGSADQEAGERPGGELRAWLFQPKLAPRQVTLDRVAALITRDENLVWIDLSGYIESDFRAVADQVALPDRIAASVLASWERPHVDVSGDTFSASVTVADVDIATRRTIARQLDLVVGRNFLISAHKQPVPFHDSLLARASTDPDLVRLDSGFMLFIVLDELLEYYEELEEETRADIEQMQAHALRDNSERFLEDILQFKRYAFALTQLSQHHDQVFQAFLRPDFPFLSAPELLAHFRDLQRRLLRLSDRLEQTRQEVNNTFDIFLSHQSHRTNNVMKILTMVATILFTATFIEGIFGPSFQGIPTHTPGGFVVMLALLATSTSLELYAFHRWRWM